MSEYELRLRVGCRPSLLTKAAIQAAYSLNVGNLRDTGHSSEAAPAAAMAEERAVAVTMLADRS
jgi:hypothetical protein